MALDEGIFQDQSLELAGDKDGVEVVHLGDHQLRLGVVGSVVLKVLAHPVFQLLGLAHIDDLAGLVHHQIDPRCQGQVRRLFLQFLPGHDAASFGLR